MIIGVAGKKQSGKNLICDIIQYLQYNQDQGANISFEKYEIESLGYTNKWQQKAFAGKVKQILSILTGIPIQDFEKEEVKNSYLGEEWNRWFIDFELCKHFGPFISEYEAVVYCRIQANKGKYLHIYEERITVRQSLQWIGTDLFRDKFHPNTWVNALMSDYKSHKELQSCWGADEIDVYPNWIITDVRFQNEAQAIKNRDGILIRVNRPCNECFNYVFHKQECSKWSMEEHESENSLDDYEEFDYVIENDGSIEDLIEKVKDILIKEKLI